MVKARVGARDRVAALSDRYNRRERERERDREQAYLIWV
jgi:hypothetical protein